MKTEVFCSPQEHGSFLYRYLNIAATEDISDLSSTCFKNRNFGRFDPLLGADAPAVPDHILAKRKQVRQLLGRGSTSP